MTENEMSKRIRREIEDEMPELLNDIEESCENAPIVTALPKSPVKKRRITAAVSAVAACLVFFVGGLFAGLLGSDPDTPGAKRTDTVIYMDVNPSIELSLDADGRVISCSAGNKDGDGLLTDLELEGAGRDDAISAVLRAMYLNGYLTEENNAVLISVDGIEHEPEEELLRGITDRVNTVFEEYPISCSIITQTVDPSGGLKERADEYCISPGKMHLIDKLVGELDLINDEDLPTLTSLSVSELNLIYSSAREESEGFSGDIVSGMLGGYVAKEEAITSILEYIGEESYFYEVIRAEADCLLIDGEVRLVYCISVKSTLFFEKTYSFTIDCKTGELFDPEINFGFLDNFKF